MFSVPATAPHLLQALRPQAPLTSVPATCRAPTPHPPAPPRPSTQAPRPPMHHPYSVMETLSPSRKNSLLPPGSDSRRSSLTKRSLTDLAQDAKKGIKNVKDTSMKAGQKNPFLFVVDSTKETRQRIIGDVEATTKMVKDKTVSVSGHMKDATVGASQWVASQTSRTAKVAMEQAKAGMSFGEKFTLYTVEKITTFSKKGFTHVFMFLVLALYTALGALLFIAIEGPHENEEKHDIESERKLLLERLWDHQTLNKDLNFTRWEEIATDFLKRYDKQLYHSWSVGISPDTDDRIWTFWKAMFFCSTITTTIGYGHIFPRTSAGRALTIVYAILGIPIFLILMADFGKVFTRLLKSLFVLVRRMYRSATCKRVRKTRAVQSVKSAWRKTCQWCSTTICRRKEMPAETPQSDDTLEALVDDNFNLPISLALFILLVYIMIGCVIYTMWESWTYFEAFYFIFISMTTIGFGDYVPDHPAFMMMTTVYLVFGLALTAMCINIIQEKMTNTFRAATEKMKESIQLMMNNAAQGEDGEGSEGIDLPEGKEVEVAKVHGAKNTLSPPKA
ncbi:TWiK family of potassium channels protein 18-like isoform X5 [Portunus trituberculatus]|uniref:TWiK family of potassium channels protein 18-like isoform X5 n=1 Tax=Portunus trituberculatus TaxID=210409 RepID=UPI001E1CB4FF|nr:TWiK family of potassium channels protein 18-like isoform X5 [Portunus trituberculatus]